MYLLPFSRFQTKNSGDGRVTLVSLLNILKNFNCRHSLCTCVVEPVLQRVACFSPCRMSKRLSPTPLRNFLLVYLHATAHDLLTRAIPVSGLSVRFLENPSEKESAKPTIVQINSIRESFIHSSRIYILKNYTNYISYLEKQNILLLHPYL